jgi:hypothetical protein
LLANGTATVEVIGRPPIQLAAGDAALLPTGFPHVVRDHRGSRAVPYESVAARFNRDADSRVTLGGAGAPARLIAGCFQFAGGQRSRLLDALPAIMHIGSTVSSRPSWLATTVRYLIDETAKAAF